jgi:hypothetical protein
MNLFKPKPKPAPLSLKERVAEFWKWFSANAERFHATIQDKKCAELQPETTEAMKKWMGDMSWVYGPGENMTGHSLTLTGEGFLPKQFVAEYWASRAPKLKGWTFYSSRQPSEADGWGFKIHLRDSNEDFKPIEFWVFPYVNEDEEKIDIKVWHPSIHRLPENTRFMALFLILDELLCEHGTQNWIGEIKFSEEHLKKSIPISELPELIQTLEREHGWKKYPPTDTYSSYELKPQANEWLRSDTFAGTTRYFGLLRQYFNAEGPCEHPFPGVGLDYVFISIARSYFPKGDEVNARGIIEDDILAALEAEGAGISLGGASGHENLYLDFAIYDGERSIEIIKSVLKKHKVPKKTKIHFFTSDRAKEVISI